MSAQRLRAGLRGWGGVGAMAVLCALALAFVLLLPRARPGGDGELAATGPRAAEATQARAGSCVDSTAQDLSPAPSGADGAAIDAIKSRGYLTVGVDQNSYRWGYRNPNRADGDLEGFDIDLVTAIAKNIFGSSYSADKIHLRAIPTNQRTAAIKNKTVDMVVRTMTISCARLDDVAFSAPYFVTGQQVLAPKTSAITGYDTSLAGKRICSAATSTASARLATDKRQHKLPAGAVVMEPVPNQLDCLVRLQLGEADAVVTDGALAASLAAQDPTVQLKGPLFTKEYYGVAMNRSDVDLVRRVNQILEGYRTNPAGWRASYEKWLLPTLGKDSESANPPVPHYK
ncbi:glutamate ABC transporter substrate-binding protein [Streptomyces sp. NPDC005423]|uniref:glutamate ABC transporter substrate-binding protein n=1 Tax=Streptomyces sp. NPDC005423 TaxID=3155343 RepID=UPI0033AC34F5